MKINIHNLTLTLILLILSSSMMYGQNRIFGDEMFAIHPKFGLMSNYYTSDYSSFQGSVDCGIFKKGNGIGWTGGIFFEKDFNGIYQIGLGAFFADRSAISTLNNTFQSRDQNTGRTTFVTLENKMDSKISYLEISPEFRLILKDNLINGPIRFLTGFRIGIPIQKDFTQNESVVSPSNATFINADGLRTTSRPLAQGTINEMNTQFGISAGFENLLKIGNNNFLSQQIVFDYNFNDIVKNTVWKTFAVRLELGLRFSIQNSTEPEPVPEPTPEPTPVPEPVKEIAVVKEEVKPIPTLNLETNISNETKLETGNEILATLPLVNYVFFEQNSSEIPNGYNRNMPVNFDLYKGDAVRYHKNILPAIAQIVNQNPNSRIMLEGATSGNQLEPKGLELAKARALSVKQALVDLGVPDDNISYRALTTPRFPSNQQYPEGIAENQRVDILVTDAPLQQYVSVQNYAEINGTVELKINYQNYPENTKALANVNNSQLTFDKPGNYRVPFRKRLEQNASNFSLVSNVSVNGDNVSDTNIIEIEKLSKDIVELSLKNFEALLRFNYNSSDLTEENQILLRQLIHQLPEGSTILIIGSADMLGTAEHNQQLAGDRARKTENFIKNIAGSKIKIQTTTNVDKFSDETPQGRFLNRSIKIRVH